MCATCDREGRAEEAERALSKAIASIHPERRWAHLDSGLMGERLSPLWWRFSVGGKVQTSGEDYDALRRYIDPLEVPRLLITGAETGIGKTSLAVGLMHAEFDLARVDMVQSDGNLSDRAIGARFIASIDLNDPNVLRAAHGAPFLVLDDAGQEGRGGGFKGQEKWTIVGDLLDRRERTPRRRTVVTTFGTREQWGTWYGGRITRLYWDMPSAAVLEMKRCET